MKQVSDEKLVMAEGDGWVFSVEVASTGSVMLHMDVQSYMWGVKMYRDMKSVWVGILEEFKKRGIDEVFSLIPKDDKIERFQDMFGLTPLLEFQDSTLYRRVC